MAIPPDIVVGICIMKCSCGTHRNEAIIRFVLVVVVDIAEACPGGAIIRFVLVVIVDMAEASVSHIYSCVYNYCLKAFPRSWSRGTRARLHEQQPPGTLRVA